MRFSNKVCIVTGSARGLGKAMAERLASEGGIMVLADVDGEFLDETVKQFQIKGYQAEGYIIDLTNVSEIDQMIDYIAQKYGRIDVLVNNAGMQIRKWATEFPEEEFDFLMDLNLKAYFFATRAAARYFKKQGYGAVVCTSSGNSIRPASKRSPYAISKAAVNGLAQALGNELGRFGIRINAVAPGYVMTDMVKQGIKEGIIDIDAIMSVLPMKRLLEPSEIASAVAFLASSDASGINGQTLFVDAGWSANGLPESKDLE
ncbi:SDR family oxidoreductase [Schaalia sp. ZJ405]|uniref:SDR family NAD(P)-dependent oxidoreductase n=1 Tax=Schaalia sp. ZJ405 TaxID=2709403 RepID=UPI0013EC8924|nr:SDR family oxidoreductase [Schaalia sp. ZJ405]QPK81267.1 SDR family oxidoreductase [Schaalia sp. ZJ405]